MASDGASLAGNSTVAAQVKLAAVEVFLTGPRHRTPARGNPWPESYCESMERDFGRWKGLGGANAYDSSGARQEEKRRWTKFQ
jgi:hypothetical protein